MRMMSMIMGAALGATLLGCEGKPTGIADGGEVLVEIQGSDTSGSDGTSAAEGMDSPGTPQSADPAAEGRRNTTAALDGEVRVRARVYVWTDARGWVELTSGSTFRAMRADGRDGAHALAAARVRTGSYTRVRVEFEDVRASLQSGITIGGSLLDGEVVVTAGSNGRVTVEREVAMEIGAGAQSRLKIDLNSGAWLGQANLAARSVSEGAFASAVSVTAH